MAVEETHAPARRGWESRDLLRAAVLLVGVWAALKLFWLLRPVFIITVLGILFGIAMTPAVDWLHERLRIKRGLGAALTMLAVVGLLVGAGFLLAPTLRDQSAEMKKRLPDVIDKVEKWVTPQGVLGGSGAGQSGAAQEQRAKQSDDARKPQPSAAKPDSARQAPEGGKSQPEAKESQKGGGSLREQLQSHFGEISQYLFPILSTTAEAITGLVLILFIAMYYATDPSLYRKGLLHLVPHRHRSRGREVLVEVGDSMRRWLIARLLAMVIIGVVTGGVMALLGIRLAATLGVIAGILEFVPFFGPIVAAIPAVGMALVDSPQKAIWVVVAFVAIQQLEGNVVTPLLLKKRVDIPPLLTIVAVPAMTLIFGLTGVLIAEPLLAIILIVAKMLYVQDVVGDDVPVGQK
jgi:predicted PurR-regulated permease PerM